MHDFMVEKQTMKSNMKLYLWVHSKIKPHLSRSIILPLDGDVRLTE